MPNVPNVPGVPTLTSFSPDALVLLAADALSNLGIHTLSEWGIFRDGVQALPEAESIVSFGYKQDWSISDYPVQDGGFQSYDKVQLPFDARVKVSSGGSEAARRALIDALDLIANSLNLFDIVTPEKVYTSVNVTHVDYHRTATNGVGLIVADVWFIEVRVASTAAFSNTQQPGEAGQQSGGNVQAQQPSDVVSQHFNVSEVQ